MIEPKGDMNFIPLSDPIPITEQVWAEGTIPLVHTRTMTFMHENYIRDCIEGILKQKTTFPVQILIHDDASPDNTPSILEKYQSKYPSLIKVFYQKNNTHFNKTCEEKLVLRKEFYSWRIGKYEAICEGDDYWTDPLKLQKQVDFLEANPDYGMVHTDADQYYTKSGKRIKNFNKQFGYKHNENDVFEDILRSNYSVFTCTALVRRDYLQYVNQGKTFKMGDTTLWLEIAHRAKIKYFPESTAVRNVLEESATQSKDWNKKLEFKKSGYKLMKHFIEKYGCSSETKEIVHEKFNRVILNHAYKSKNKVEAQKAFAKLKDMKHIKFEDRIYFWGTTNKLNRLFAILLMITIKAKRRILKRVLNV